MDLSGSFFGLQVSPSAADVRRWMLCTWMLMTTCVLGFPSGNLSADDGEPPGQVTRISEHLFVFSGPINVGIIRDAQRALLIDCGDGSVAGAIANLGVTEVSQVLFTHYHRDQLCGVDQVITDGTQVSVPAGEASFFADPASYWNDDSQLYRVYRSFRPHPLMPTEPLPVNATVEGGQELEFGAARIRVLDTPGHTGGSVSYMVEVDGQRTVFCGDTIAGPGQIWDLYSLQAGFEKNGQSVGGYHGFMGDWPVLVESLQRIKSTQPTRLVPSHGSLMDDPARSIDQLIARLGACYENYVSISALRHYFPKLFLDYAETPGQMPIRAGFAPPACLRHVGTTWMLVADTNDVFVMDVGSPNIVERLQQMQAEDEIRNVEGLWVTHYHFDHTDGIPAFQQTFDCPCYAERKLADVLLQPAAWRLPCLAPETIRVDHVMRDGESWQWRDFKLTSFFYPGQTLYHAALLVERDDLRMLFVGDSHTMAGNDDYCAQNRNLLGRGVGFQYCLELIRKLQPTHLFNCHVDQAFNFSSSEIEMMVAKLDQREQLFGQLVPWEHANFGLDSSWVRCDPYLQVVQPGSKIGWEVVITNHSTVVQQARSRLQPPADWNRARSAWQTAEADPKKEIRLPLSIVVPADATAGRYVVPVDVEFGKWQLPAFAEAIVEIQP